jgi:chemotaxis protein CheY-P-specific phosphatase CheC
MENLNKNELQVATTIVRQGLLRAADSLSFFMKEKVGISALELQVHNGALISDKTGKNIHLLTTEIKGELPGVCYLIFSEEEANALRDIALSVEIKSNPVLAAEMNDAIMLEVDNIISASVITEFSNLLKQKMYGDVPALKLVDRSELCDLLQEGTNKNLFVINFKTSFMSSNLNFCPEFVWLFNNKFLDSIKELSKKQEAGEILIGQN